ETGRRGEVRRELLELVDVVVDPGLPRVPEPATELADLDLVLVGVVHGLGVRSELRHGVERGAAAEDVDERLRLEVPDPRAGRVPRPLDGDVRVLREELAVEDVARDGPEQVRRGQR